MIYLLDVSVLIALFDREHVNCSLARDWFKTLGGGATDRASWATCPIAENGVLRIMGSRSYPGSPGSPAAVAGFLEALIGRGGHVFWPDSISLRDAGAVLPDRLLTSAQLTDTYLLALARRHGGKLATLDRRIAVAAVPDGARHLHLLE